MLDVRDDGELRLTLLREVSYLNRYMVGLWNQPIVEVLNQLHELRWSAVFFGGTLRSLLLSRLLRQKPGRPRDVDIVVAGASVPELRSRFDKILTRETRFGGLQLQKRHWRFDVWPLDQTWAFINSKALAADFESLPRTTFLNIEAIAVDVWPSRGRQRNVYSGDGQFFDAIRTRTLEINLEDNPYPALCVVRSLVLAASLDFGIGARLAHYIAKHGESLSADDLEEIQRHHYGVARYPGAMLRRWIDLVGGEGRANRLEAISLPRDTQLPLWEVDEHTDGEYAPRVHLRAGST